MKRTFRTTVAALALAAVAALAGCSGLPIDGAFQPGNATGETDTEARWQFSSDGPEEGAEPVEIVLGFLDAGESSQGDWAVAREFLTPQASATWDPHARITIDSINDREVGDFVETAEGTGDIDARVTPTATIDETGSYTVARQDVRPLDFSLTRIDGEWRISSVPKGVVVQSGSFRSIFTGYTLMFSGPDNRLVPDVRWFADAPDVADRLVTALVEDGPAAWLAAAVSSAFDDVDVLGVRRDDDGVYTVALSGNAANAGADQRARMQTQLEATLGGAEVRMTAAGARITAPQDTIESTQPDSRPIVLADTAEGTAFGYLAGGQIAPIPGLSEVIADVFVKGGDAADPATSIAVTPDLDGAVLQGDSGKLWWAAADETYDALSYETDWVEPSLDPFGHVWTMKPDQPDRIHTWNPQHEPRELQGVAALTDVSAIAVSRDGARVSIAGRIEDQAVLVVAGVRRDGDLAPVGLSGIQDITPLPGTAFDLAWVSDTVVAATVPGDGRTLIREQTVGGESERLTASFGIAELTYGNAGSRERVLADDGSLYVRARTTWRQAGGDVLVLATQTGSAPAV